MKKVLIIVLDVIAVLLIAWFALGYFNFYKITSLKEPIYVVREKDYDVSNGHVHVYDNIIYKIVEYKSSDITYSIKLWFMEDI